MLKKVLVFLLVFTFVFLGVSCGSKDNPIKIGCYTHLTGSMATEGLSCKNAVNLAVKQINEKGGLLGRKVEVIIYDDQGIPETGVKVATKLIEVDKVIAIVGSANSPIMRAVMPINEKAKVLVVTGGVSPTIMNLGNKYTFRSTGSAAATNKSLVDSMVKFGVKKLGVLVIASDYGKDGLADLKKSTDKAGIEVISESYNPGDSDYTPQLTKLLKDGATHLMLYGNTNEQAIGMKQVRSVGYTGFVFGTEGCSSPEIRDVAGESANGCVYAASTVIPDKAEDAANDLEKAFLEAYIKEYGQMIISDVGYRAYDGIQLIFEALRTAKDITKPESISEAFFAIKNFKGIHGTYDYTSGTGEGLSSSNMYIIYGNKNVPLDKYLAANPIKP